LPLESLSPAAISFIAQVEQAYASLMQSAAARGEENLGGKLLYAGELDEPGRILAVAGNIAGAATLAGSAHRTALRQAMRSGAIDFLVTSLDEALRILKNEIRKRQPIAVGVSVPAEEMLRQMLDRGVLPDLLPPLLQSSPAPPEFAAFMARGAQRIAARPLQPGSKFLIWPIPADFALRPAEFDALLLKHVSPDDHAKRRWLRLSPRYLGPEARRFRSLACSTEIASMLIDLLGPPLQP
jgi:hypothetical protein